MLELFHHRYILKASSIRSINHPPFENFILADEPFGKAVETLETCVSVNNSLCGKFVSSLEFPIKFDPKLL